MQPLVSVIISTWNGEKTIKRAINSALNQTYKNLEVVVYNDFSDDKTEREIKSIKDDRVIYIKGTEKKNGPYGRNTAFRHSKGKYIALLDDDDEWKLDKIEKQVNFLELNEGYGLVLNDFIIKIGHKEEYVCAKSKDYMLGALDMSVRVAAGSNLMIKREPFEEIGMFDERFEGHQDLQVLLMLLRKNLVGYISEPLSIIYGSSRRPLKNAKRKKKNFAQIKQFYLDIFKEDIEKYPESVQKRIYARNWLQIARFYLTDGEIDEAFKSLKKSLNYKFLFSYRYKILPFDTYVLFIPHIIKRLFKWKK